MELAHSLIRSVMRAFYATENILIIDALALHSALRDDDLAHLMGQQTKHVRKLCSKLRDDGLVSVHSRAEMREGAQRPFNRDYYFINFHHAIDVIKFKLKSMSLEIERRFDSTEEKKEYFCPQCKSEYTQMEVLDEIGPGGNFTCKQCKHDLVIRNDDDGVAHAGHEVKGRLNAQLAAFEDLMRQIDATTIPENDFDNAIANALPVQRNESTNPQAKSEPVRLPQAGVKGLKTGPEKIEISLIEEGQASKEAEAAEEERKAKLAAQNALPAWHTASTVTGERTALGMREEAARREREANGLDAAGLKPEQEDKKDSEVLGDSTGLDAYFAALKEEQEREAQRIKEEEEEDDEEDDDDDDDDDEDEDELGFEDVGLNGRAEKRVRIEEPVSSPASNIDDIKPSSAAAKLAEAASQKTNGLNTESEEGEDDDDDEGDFEDAL